MVVRTVKTEAIGWEVNVSKLLVELGACSSRAAAKRLIRQGAVEIYPNRESDPVLVGYDCEAILYDGNILHCGKRFWRQIQLPPRELTFEKEGFQVKILDVGE